MFWPASGIILAFVALVIFGGEPVQDGLLVDRVSAPLTWWQRLLGR